MTFTTGADGTVLIVGNQQSLGWTLWENRTYALVEVTAPAGYELDGGPTYFVLSGSPSSQMEYDLTGDQFSVQDTPVKISIPVTKTWIGPAGESVVVHLYADDADTGMTVTLTEQNNWTDTFENLRKYDETGTEIPYRVEEEPIAGYDPQYSGSAEAGFTVTNINNFKSLLTVSLTPILFLLDITCLSSSPLASDRLSFISFILYTGISSITLLLKLLSFSIVHSGSVIRL